MIEGISINVFHLFIESMALSYQTFTIIKSMRQRTANARIDTFGKEMKVEGGYGPKYFCAISNWDQIKINGKQNQIAEVSSTLAFCFFSCSFLIRPKYLFFIWFCVLPSRHSYIDFQFLPYWFSSSTRRMSSSIVQWSRLVSTFRKFM